jgi:hypothetical protein
MRFGQTDGFLVASLITGPKHALLQLRLAKERLAVVPCDPLPAIGDCRHRELDAGLIVEAVLKGVAEANERIGSQFYPTHVRYVSDDTGPEGIYGVLAAALVEEVASGRLVLP